MRVVVVGLGNQGRKRALVAGADLVATVDPLQPEAKFRCLDQVPLDSFDAALVCVPDQSKREVLQYLLANGKHTLVEKPLFDGNKEVIRELLALAQRGRAAIYTAYNHRFEPHLVALRDLLEKNSLGKLYTARLFYGNGTARDVRMSPWRDRGLGVLSDLGSHLIDLSLFLFGSSFRQWTLWQADNFENLAFDHAVFAASGNPLCECEVSLVSWKNSFSIDIYGELGSAHVEGLCKWGPSRLTVRRRVLPSGRPTEDVTVIELPDPTWKAEYAFFSQLCQTGGSSLENDIWIDRALRQLTTLATWNTHSRGQLERGDVAFSLGESEGRR
ncbi:MAG: Gfo/Idh/MocA family oxidoreductase [Verrucomicrobia bacterium]|nr:Gfo/Idh/MocA family oxidoreductase [Verrucomicrobiota bacterium]